MVSRLFSHVTSGNVIDEMIEEYINNYVDIPFGNPEDPPGKETVCGLGNMKNCVFNQILGEDGAVEVYED